MNREIKYRGKKIHNGEWVYGHYVKTPSGECRIYWKPFDNATNNTYHKVIPETIGEFTGLQDKNKKDIYEGDVIEGTTRYRAVVVFEDGCFLSKNESGTTNYITMPNYFEVIGNIHENPELLNQ